MDKFSLPACSAIFRSRTEYKDTCDFSLPDFAQSSSRILGADGFSFVSDVILQDGFLKFTVNTNVKIAYISEQNGYIKSVSYPFSKEKSVETKGITEENALPFVSAVCTFVSAKQKNPRSFEITVGNSVCAEIYAKDGVSLFNPEEISDALLHSEKILPSEHEVFFDFPESLSFEFTVDENMPPVAEIADNSLNLCTQSALVSNEMLKYRAKAVFNCVYREQNQNDSKDAVNYVYFSKEFPVEGSVEAPGIPDNSAVLAKMFLLEYDCGPSFDPYGESRIINVNMKYSASFDVFFSVEKEYVDDGYSPLYDCEIKSAPYFYEKLFGVFDEKCAINGSIHYDSVPLVNINSVHARILSSGTETSEDKLLFTGKLFVSASGVDEKGDVRYVSGSVPIRTQIQSAELPSSDRKILTECELLFCDAILKNGEISVNAEANVKGVILEKDKINAISDFSVNYDAPKPQRRNEYVLYYPDPDDTLWEIGKKYEVPVSVIKSENSIENESIKGKKVIRIPLK